LFAAAGTSPIVIERLNKALNTALQEADVRSQFEGMGLIVRFGPPDRLTQQLKDDAALYRRVIDVARLKFDPV
jgi:tripartite-type tricarboxylate transporter receptor subunit TctC